MGDFDPSLFDPDAKHDPNTTKPAGRLDSGAADPASPERPEAGSPEDGEAGPKQAEQTEQR